MKFLAPLLISFFIISCGSNESNDGESTDSGSVMKSENLDTCKCQELLVDSLGIHKLEQDIYTGVCLEFYPNSEDKYIEKNLLNGKMHGKVTYFDRSGEVLIEEIYEKGNKKRSGEVDVLTCDCSELVKQESNMVNVPNRFFLDDIPYTGSCEKWYPDSSQIYMEASYKDGLLDGHTIYYNRDGSTMIIEKYEVGALVSTVH